MASFRAHLSYASVYPVTKNEIVFQTIIIYINRIDDDHI